MRSWFIVAALAAPTVAAAQQQVCQSVYTHAEWTAHMDAVDDRLREFDLDGARKMLTGTHQSLLCLGEIVQPAHAARLARQLSFVFFLEQDADATRLWALSSRVSWDGMPWPSDIDETHPFHEAFDEAEWPVEGGFPEKGLVVPAKGGAFANGHPLLHPEAPAEVPLFIQVADKRGAITEQYWQDGAAFPEHLVGPPVDLRPPRWFVAQELHAGLADTSPLFGEPAVASAPEPDDDDDYDDDVPEPEPEPEPAVAAAPDPVPEPAPEPDPVPEPAVAVAPDPAPEPAPEPDPVPVPVAVPEPAVAAAPDPAPEPAVAAAPQPTTEDLPEFAFLMAAPDDYVDPFEAARLRAISRETSERQIIDYHSGTRTTVRSELTTFVEDSGSTGAVTNAEYQEWLPYAPQWRHDDAIDAGTADKHYLKDWKKGEPPSDRMDAPITWVSWQAAFAYCEEFGNGMASAEVSDPGQKLDEWRQIDGEPAQRTTAGDVLPWETDTDQTFADVGFRCLN